MISREQVILAYRLILGREPESEEAIEAHVKAYDSLEDLRDAFFRSQEAQVFMGRYFQGTLLDMAPSLPIQIDVDPLELEQLLSLTEKVWAGLGRNEPYWSVITQERFKQDTFEDHKDAYFNSGKPDVVRLLTWLERNSIDVHRLKHCMELGCGTGRVTRWLALQFQSVAAHDISIPHLDLARRHLRQQGCTNVTLHLLRALGFVQELQPMDLFFSILVLQHNPPPIIAHILQVVFQKLRPGGIAYFQVPTYCKGYRFQIEEYLRIPADAHGMEMHVLPQREIFTIAHGAGCRIVEVRRDGYAMDPGWLSNTFLIEKPAAEQDTLR